MLHQEQKYILEIGKELKVNTKILHHKRPTISCEEKLELLKEKSKFSDWNLEQIVKCLFFSKNDEQFIGVITPSSNKYIDTKELFLQVLGITRKKAKGYWINPKNTPTGMSWGTCTPFPLTSTLGNKKEIGNIIFYDYPEIDKKIVDISIGGNDKKMLQVSMHIQYKAIYDILTEKFGERIHLYKNKIS